MYTTKNFKTKKELKEAVASYLEQQETLRQVGMNTPESQKNVLNLIEPVTLYAPGLGKPNDNGRETVEGPHYPEPHRWYAQVEVIDGIVVKVK
jgi:hypothetical protein